MDLIFGPEHSRGGKLWKQKLQLTNLGRFAQSHKPWEHQFRNVNSVVLGVIPFQSPPIGPEPHHILISFGGWAGSRGAIQPGHTTLCLPRRHAQRGSQMACSWGLRPGRAGCQYLVHLPLCHYSNPWNDVGISGTQPIHSGTRLFAFSGTKEVCAASCKDQHPREPPTNEGSGSTKKGLPHSLLLLHRPAVGRSACFSKGPRRPHGPSQRLPFEASLVLALSFLCLTPAACDQLPNKVSASNLSPALLWKN